jgi:hypothetical protein
MISRKVPLFAGLLFVAFINVAMGRGDSTWKSFSDGYAENTSPIVRLSQSHTDGFIIEIEIPGIQLYEKLAKDKKFVSVNVPPYDSTTPQMVVTSTSEIGKPKLPIFRAFIAIPQHTEVIRPEIIASSFCVLEDICVYPTGKLVDHSGEFYEEFTIDDGFYSSLPTTPLPPFIKEDGVRGLFSSDVLYPPLLARTIGSFYLRDTHLTCLEICPFQYNPAKKQLRCYWKIQLRIRFNNARTDSGVLSDMFASLTNDCVLWCSKAILNYPRTIQRAPAAENTSKEGNVYNPTNLSKSCKADYLIIAPDVFYKHPKVTDLASWRTKYNGFDVAIVNTSDIYRQFGGGDDGIRNFIKYAYEFWTAPNSSDGHLAYVLFVGDVEYIPTHLSNNNIFFEDTNIATDNWYACLSGDDYIPDVMLGRLSVKNTYELDVVMDKIIQYEKNPYRGEWVKRVLLITGTIESQIDDLEYTKNEILLPAGYIVTELSKLAGDDFEDVIYEINRGHIIVDYVGHGFRDGWEIFRQSCIPDLNNKRMLPVIFNMACSTTAFDDEKDCFAESMLKAPNGGCVAFFGSSRLTSTSEIAFSLSRGMVQNHLFVLGEIVMNVKLLSTLSEQNLELYNLLGDPALSLYAPRSDYYRKSDLAISPADITFVPEEGKGEATSNSLVEINAVVHNIGETGAEDVIVEFFRDGVTHPLPPPEKRVTQQFIGKRKIDYIPPKGTGEASISWRVPRGKAQNKILVKANPVDGEEYSYDNHAVKTLWVSIEAKNFPIVIDSSISSSTSSASAPVLFDLDGDGDMELIAIGEQQASSSFYVSAWRRDGALMENFPVSTLASNQYRQDMVELSPAVGDVDSDGFAEIVCVMRTKKIYLLRHNGRIAGGFPVQLRAFAASPPVLYDVNGDGKLEIILALTNGEVDVLKYDGTPLDGFPVFVHSNSQSAFAPPTVAIGDVDGDGKPEIVVKFLRLNDNLGEYVILNHDGSRIENSPLEIPGANLFPPSLGDVDNDCCAEIILVSEEKNLYVLNHNGTLKAGFPTMTKNAITSPPVLGDIDGDGLLEIVATSIDCVYAWHHDGACVSGFPIYARGENSHPIIADMDGDSRSEIIFVNKGIQAYHHDGSPVDGFPIKFDSYKISALSLADVDVDGYLEMAVTTGGGEIHLLDDVGIYNPGCMEWPTALHDAMNTNAYSAQTTLPMPKIYLKSTQQDRNIVLSWRKESDLKDITFYKILRAVFPTGPFLTLATVGKNESMYVDNTATVNVSYWYRIVAENGTETPIVSNIASACLISSEIMLRDVCNYPNPAPGAKHPDSTIFRFYVAEDAKVRISIYNIAGQLVDEINHDARGDAYNEVEWKISSVASGLYFYMVEATRKSGEKVNKIGRLVVRK